MQELLTTLIVLLAAWQVMRGLLPYLRQLFESSPPLDGATAGKALACSGCPQSAGCAASPRSATSARRQI